MLIAALYLVTPLYYSNKEEEERPSSLQKSFLTGGSEPSFGLQSCFQRFEASSFLIIIGVFIDRRTVGHLFCRTLSLVKKNQ